MEALVEGSSFDAAAAFTPMYAAHEARILPFYGAVAAAGPAKFRRTILEAVPGLRLSRDAHRRVRYLSSDERNRFALVDLRDQAGTRVHEVALSPLGLDRVVRAFLYRNAECVGWVGLFDTEEVLAPTACDCERLQDLVAPLIELFVATMLQSDAEFATLDHSGVMKATKGAWELVAEESTATSLLEHVRKLGKIGTEELTVPVGPRVIRLSQLHGEESDAFHADFQIPALPALSAYADLTPRQRDVASLAALGKTNPEIADELDITRETVKSHLSTVYRRLDIANRRELAARLAEESEAWEG